MPPPPDELAREHPSILVVEDEPDVASTLCELLQAGLPWEARIRVAGNAMDGARALREEQFDLLMCDFKLPDRSGVELLAEARWRAPRTRRVLMTAFADLQVAVDAINHAGVDHFIQKPFEPDEVLGKVEQLLKEKRARDDREAAFAKAFEPYRHRIESGA